MSSSYRNTGNQRAYVSRRSWYKKWVSVWVGRGGGGLRPWHPIRLIRISALKFVMRDQCDAYGYLPGRRASLPADRKQTVRQNGERGFVNNFPTGSGRKSNPRPQFPITLGSLASSSERHRERESQPWCE